MFDNERFKIVVTPLKDPKQMPEMIEHTLLAAIAHLSEVGRKFAAHDQIEVTVTNNISSFHVQSDMYGGALEFARLLIWNDRVSPLHPRVMPRMTPELTASAQGLIDLLDQWFMRLPPLTMNAEARRALFLSVQAAEKVAQAMPNALDSKVARAISDRTKHMLPGVASLLGLDSESCQERIIFLATQVMPVWREWLGGIEPTDLPLI